MSSIQFCASFALELYEAIHDFTADTFKIALYTSSASLDYDTTAYSATNEVASGNGYTTGGATASVSSGYPQTITTVGRVAAVRFDDVSWTFTGATSFRYGLLYNSSKSNRAICILDLGSLSANGSFTISFPLTNDPVINTRVPILT